MDRQEILEVIKNLAKSQGFYGRVLASIDALDEFQKEVFWQELEGQEFSSVIDVVMFFEC